MHHSLTYSKGQIDKIMTVDQFDRVVEAILAGKYSWACVLILEAAGYNPLHYVPYRTYNRLIKNNRRKASPKPEKLQVVDLEHISSTNKPAQLVKGGAGIYPYAWQYGTADLLD